jgi:hypothetical protein
LGWHFSAALQFFSVGCGNLMYIDTMFNPNSVIDVTIVNEANIVGSLSGVQLVESGGKGILIR